METTRFRIPAALSSVLAAPGILQPRTVGILNRVVSLVSLPNYYVVYLQFLNRHYYIYVYNYYVIHDPSSMILLLYTCRFTYRSSENQRVVSKLVDEVRGLNPNFISQHIRGMLIIIT